LKCLELSPSLILPNSYIHQTTVLTIHFCFWWRGSRSLRHVCKHKQAQFQRLQGWYMEAEVSLHLRELLKQKYSSIFKRRSLHSSFLYKKSQKALTKELFIACKTESEVEAQIKW